MNFRHWLQEKWFEHKDECERWSSVPCPDANSYFQKYKWWLKREFRHHQEKENLKHERRKLYG